MRIVALSFLALITAAVPARAEGDIPDPAAGWDRLWSEVLIDMWIIGVVFGVAAVYMMIRYRAKSPDQVGKAPKLSRAQAVAWVLIPTAVFLAADFLLAAKGWTLWNVYRRVPDNAIEIKVTGYQWFWEFEYENGVQSDELYVPVGHPVVLRMTAEDVIHSFFIPELRVKEDVMPGRITYLWINPREERDYVATCTEYCGQGHALMPTLVRAVPRERFDAWLAAEAGS